MEEWTFLQLAEHVLRELKRPATSSEIWKYAAQKGIHKKLASQGKTPSQTLIMFVARSREQLDLETVNMLAERTLTFERSSKPYMETYQ